MSLPPDQPGNHGAGNLSPWERRMAARIENDLAAADPGLAQRMEWPPAARWWPLTTRSLVGLLVAMMLLVGAAAVVPASRWVVYGLVTVLVIVPWLVLAVVEQRRRR